MATSGEFLLATTGDFLMATDRLGFEVGGVEHGPVAVADFGLHPHSGIATVTHLFDGSVRYEDTTGAAGVLPEGGVEWFKAGHGAWHGGGPGETARTYRTCRSVVV